MRMISRGRRQGFTLIELLIVMTILAILAGVVVMAVGSVFETAGSSAYEALLNQIQNAVVEYQAATEGQTPPTFGAAYNISAEGGNVSVRVLDICRLLLPDRILRIIPESCRLVAGGANDNCDGGCMGCRTEYHYIWVIDKNGTVFSECVGAECNASKTDDYQNVWP